MDIEYIKNCVAVNSASAVIDELLGIIDGYTLLKAENARLQAIIDEANAQEPLYFVAPDGEVRDSAEANNHMEWGARFKPLYAAPIPAQQSKCYANADEACDEYIEKYGGADSDAWHDAPVDGVFKDGFNLGLAAAQQSPAVAVPEMLSDQLENFICYLIDKEEGAVIVEETLHFQLAAFLSNAKYNKPSPRITEQDAREIISKFLCGSEKTSDDGDITYWLNHEGGRHLLERLSKKQD